MEQTVWDQIIAAGLPAVLMALAVWWLQRSNTTLVEELHVERKERLDSMAAEIERLQLRSDRCEADRLDLHKQFARLIRDNPQLTCNEQ